MQFKQKFLFSVLCLWALISVSVSEASVTIRGKNLDDIDDIVSLATNGGKPEMKKYSLGVMQFRSDVSSTRRTFYTEKIINANGSAVNAHVQLSVPEPGQGGNENSMMYSAASSLTNENGRAIVWNDYLVDSTNGKLTIWPHIAFICKDGFTVPSEKHFELTVEHEKGTAASFEQGIKTGIFLPNNENEYFAVAMLKNAKIKQDSGTASCTASIFIIGMNLSTNNGVNIFDIGVVIEKNIQQGYSPVSAAVGDFMGTGTTDQIAFTTASAAGITLTVCRIKKQGGNYSYETLKEETVCTYTGRMKSGLIISRPDYYPSIGASRL